MNIIVTGATSFVGAAVVRCLLQQGHQVLAVARAGSVNLPHLLEMVPEESRGSFAAAELELGEISRIRESLTASGLFERADAWLQGGWDGAGSDNRTKKELQHRNTEYALEAVRAAAAAGCSKFLFTGSQAEYGICHEIITEDTPCRPVSEYGKAKAAVLKPAGSLCKALGMEYIHARIFSIYGPGDHPWTLVQSCLRAWRQGGSMDLSDCSQRWNFLYIEDAAAALAGLLTDGRGGVYNIAGGDTRPLRQFIEEMYALCGSRGSYRYGARPQNAEGAAELIPDIGRLCRETGWKPQVSFAEGIRRMLAEA
ncbi:MAG: NAD(P)-dependent oxidoreductase [Eubacteriales bacterium]|nr:NAD(P)-dependent oxidoreductase [Eubacteriales bacterium]